MYGLYRLSLSRKIKTMATVADKFDQGKIDRLKKYLLKEEQNGRTRDYEISVDDFVIVPRTNDVSEFDDYEMEMTNETRNLSIVIYKVNNNRNTCYSFCLKGEPEPPKEREQKMGLGEIDVMIQERVKEKLDAKDKEYEFARIKEKLAEKEEKLDEAEEYIEKIEKEITDLRAEMEEVRKGKIKNLLKQSEGVGNLIFSNVLGGIIKKIPGGEGLAGLFGGDEEEQTTESPRKETKASFEMKESEKENES